MLAYKAYSLCFILSYSFREHNSIKQVGPSGLLSSREVIIKNCMSSKFITELKSKISTRRGILINSIPSFNTFYIITNHKCNDFIPDSFNFKFGITINPKGRMQNHKYLWNAVYRNSIFVTSSNANFSKGYEFFLKNIGGNYNRSEYRKGMSNYNNICNELLSLSKNEPDLNLKFYIHRDYSIASDIGYLSNYYYRQNFFSESDKSLLNKPFYLANLTFLKKVVDFSTINNQHI